MLSERTYPLQYLPDKAWFSENTERWIWTLTRSFDETQNPLSQVTEVNITKQREICSVTRGAVGNVGFHLWSDIMKANICRGKKKKTLNPLTRIKWQCKYGAQFWMSSGNIQNNRVFVPSNALYAQCLNLKPHTISLGTHYRLVLSSFGIRALQLLKKQSPCTKLLTLEAAQ